MPGIKEKKKSTKSAKDDISPEEEAEIERQKVINGHVYIFNGQVICTL